jgi:hypothetical protein
MHHYAIFDKGVAREINNIRDVLILALPRHLMADETTIKSSLRVS